jgi:4-amino-4-deoxy-L-arabinose transferase-like glycosyltransferase
MAPDMASVDNTQGAAASEPDVAQTTGDKDVAGALPLMAEGDVNQVPWSPPPHERRVRLFVLVAAAAIFLPFLGSFGLWDPWETHYGAVTTNMLETYDWVSPWWGYKEQIGTEPQQGNHFFSKPIFIFWSEAVFAKLMGRGEWAIRLPMALLAILSIFCLYWSMSKIWSRRVGLLAAAITATSPQFFMISRQAQTDMPFVGTMIVAMCFFMMALFGPRQRLSNRRFWAWIWGALGLLLLNVIPQLVIISTDLDQSVPTSAGLIRRIGWTITHQGWVHAILFGGLLAGVIASYAISLRREHRAEGLTDALKDRWLRKAFLMLFFVMCAQSTYAKGLLGFMLPGAIIFAYLLITHSWRILARAEIIRGLLVFICVGFPWYMAMFAKHGMAYYQRFFIHDHFNRLNAGVHQIDSGTFEHFIKWLGIGMYPWAIFVPLALIWMVRQRPRDTRRQAQAALFCGLWFLIAFTLFTLASTKFHHYIFPAMPALAVATALFLDRLIDDRTWLARLAVVLGIGLFIVLSLDLRGDPQHIRNLMTYKYDRPMPEHLPIDAGAPVAENSPQTWGESVFWRHTSPSLQSVLTTEVFRYPVWISIMLALGLVVLTLMLFQRMRRASLAALAVLASAMALWSLSYYMPSLAPHWSQKYLFDAYYDTCSLAENPEEVERAYTPVLAHLGLEGFSRTLGYERKRVCEEDVISWLITWRGETYYSYNELQPIAKAAPQFMPYLETRNGGERFYVLMERGKLGAFKTKLQTYSDKLKRKKLKGWANIDHWDLKVECDESLFFQMVSATPVRGS